MGLIWPMVHSLLTPALNQLPHPPTPQILSLGYLRVTLNLSKIKFVFFPVEPGTFLVFLESVNGITKIETWELPLIFSSPNIPRMTCHQLLLVLHCKYCCLLSSRHLHCHQVSSSFPYFPLWLWSSFLDYFFIYTLGSLYISSLEWCLKNANFWRRKWQPTPVILPGKIRGQRSLAGWSPWDYMTEHVCRRVEGDGLVAINW